MVSSLALPAAETWFAPVLAEPAREEIVILRGARRIPADLYRPPTPGAALLIVHGLSRAGRRHPETVRFARLIGRQGQLVLALLAGALETEPDRRTLGAIAARRLAAPAGDTRELEARLGGDGRAVPETPGT